MSKITNDTSGKNEKIHMPYGSPGTDYVLTKKKSGKSMFN